MINLQCAVSEKVNGAGTVDPIGADIEVKTYFISSRCPAEKVCDPELSRGCNPLRRCINAGVGERRGNRHPLEDLAPG